jgi:hypothetical protein
MAGEARRVAGIVSRVVRDGERRETDAKEENEAEGKYSQRRQSIGDRANGGYGTSRGNRLHL